MTTPKPCVFCAIVAGTEPATIVREWPDAIAILPRGGVLDGGGHILVMPRCHVATAIEDATVTATVSARAAQLAVELGWDDLNFIDNVGAAASQTVHHYHRHMLRRRLGDRIVLPWPQPLQESA
jgi:histidine triad (HIT) family protein